MKANKVFEGLANTIVKRHKLIVVAWIVVILLSVGVILTQESKLSYDMTTMELKENPESLAGMDIIDEQFNHVPAVTTIVVITHANAADITGFYDTFGYTQTSPSDPKPMGKVPARYGASSVLVVSETESLPANDGGFISIYAIMYLDDSIKTTDQVPVIRELVAATLADLSKTDALVTYVTGNDAITYDTEKSSSEDMAKIDPISIMLILVLIGLFFRSFVASATPPAVVGGAYAIMLCLLFFLGNIMDIFYISPVIMLVSMLGAGCDYSIFVIARYREERKLGLDKEAAVRESVKWAGESITTSGMSVIIGFGVMSFCSFSMISSMGMVLALGIVVALLAALTLIPSILFLTGDKVFFPSKVETYQDGSKAMNGWYGNWSRRGTRYFRSTARHSMKYAKPIVIAAILFTVPMAYIMATEEGSYDMISTMPPGEAKDGVNIITESVGGGMIMPSYIVYEYNAATPFANVDVNAGTLTWNLDPLDLSDPTKGGDLLLLLKMDIDMMKMDNITLVTSAAMYQAMEIFVNEYLTSGSTTNLENLLAAEGLSPGVINEVVEELKKTADSLPGATLGDKIKAYQFAAYTTGVVSKDGNFTKTTVLFTDEPMSNTSMNTIGELREFISFSVEHDDTGMLVAAWVTGSAAMTYDISQIVSGEFTIIEIVVILLIFLLLFFVMKSYLTPIRALATIIMSIIWTIGVTHILFSFILGIPVLWMIPIILFVVCLGLGMDYDILLTTRIRENVVKGMTNDDAIEHALEKSGAVITICGLIMAGTFFTLTTSSAPMLQEFGFALGFAILIDALIVRTYIVPAIMHLMGDLNWRGPKFLGGKVSAAKAVDAEGASVEPGSEK